ncbi:MAG: hypothetical protein B6I19_06310 [Bacteroidetes bacterium 4572_114]|nr:MAG: hypothetical protein B6I19_06310 [Bacteroidetes bacterium 4572_114]
MKNYFTLLTIAIFLISANSYAQKWMNKLEVENSSNFYEVQKAFYQYYQDVPIEKYQKDYRKFKRWEYYMEPRVNDAGHFPVKTLWDESRRITKLRKDGLSNNSNWVALGPGYTPLWTVNNALNGKRSGTGRVECIEFHPTDNDIIWVGVHSGGLWKTTDGGDSWFVTSDDLLSIGISDIVVHPTNPDVLYIGTGDRDTDWTYSIGLLKSTDGGETFEETGLKYEIQENDVITEIIINPENPETLVVSTTEGIYKSTDSGDEWELVKPGNFRDMASKPGNPDVIYASTYSYGGGAKLYRSTDGGSSFEVVGNTGVVSSAISRISIGTTPANPEIVYFVCCRASGQQANLYGVYKSEDNGGSWEEAVSGDDINLLGRSLNGGDTEGYGWYTLSIEVSQTNANQLFVGGINLWRSDDGGHSWNIKTTEIPNVAGVTSMWVDHHEIRINPATNTLFTAHDGGIYKSDDNCDSFTDITDGLNINQMYRIGCSASDENVVVAGCQDQFGMLYHDGGWNALYTGEASEHFIDYNDPQTLYCYGFYFGMIKSVNGGYSYTNINPPGVGNMHWLAPTIMHPTDANTIYLGVNGIYKSTDQGSSWETLIPSLAYTYELESLVVAASDDQYMYAASPIKIWRSSDGGKEWETIYGGLPGNRIITDIAVSNTDPEHLWISLARFNENSKVYESTDGGETWENISGNLPNVPVHTIVHEAGTVDGIYIGTDIGIFYTNKILDEWIDFSNGLPNVVVNEIEIHYGSNKLRAGTYGRGLWESELYDNTTAVDAPSHTREFTVVPNPVNDEFVINIKGSGQEVVSFRLKDIYGRNVQLIEQSNSHNRSQYHFNGSYLKSGIYIVELLINGQTAASKKIIKM